MFVQESSGKWDIVLFVKLTKTGTLPLSRSTSTQSSWGTKHPSDVRRTISALDWESYEVPRRGILPPFSDQLSSFSLGKGHAIPSNIVLLVDKKKKKEKNYLLTFPFFLTLPRFSIFPPFSLRWKMKRLYVSNGIFIRGISDRVDFWYLSCLLTWYVYVLDLRVITYYV